MGRIAASPRHSTTVLVLAAVLGTGLWQINHAAEPASRPNVVLILTDDQGTLDANCSGSADLHTPALDALQHMAQRRVLVLMLSDFLFDLDREQLGPVAFRHDLVGIAVNHLSEMEPPACGLAAVRDSEKGEAVVADFGLAGRDVCKNVFDGRRSRLREEFAAARADLLELDTRTDCAEELARFFRHRLRRTADETGG